MRKIYLKSLRDMLRMKVRVVSIWLLVSVVVFIYAGGYMARESLYHTRDVLTERLHLSDIQVIFSPASPDEMPDLVVLEREAIIARRLVSPGGMELKDGSPLACLVVYMDPSGHPKVNDLQIIAGDFLSPDDDKGVVIEKSLAEIHGYRIGDTITLNFAFPLEVTVRGIAVSPECLVSPANPRIPLPSKGSLGIIFASLRLIEQTFGYPLYNDLSFRMRNPDQRARFQEELPARLRGLAIKQIIPREEQFGYHFLTEDLKEFNIIISPVVFIFFLITAIVIVLTFSRLIISQKKQIGIAMALGYTNRTIALSYVLMAAILGMGGAVLGTLVSFKVNTLYASIYGRIIGIPEIIYTTTWRHIAHGALLGMALALTASAIPLRRLRSLSPQIVIREEPETVMHGLLAPLRPLERSMSRWTGHSLAWKVGLRNIFRRPRLALATITLIALAISQSTTFLISVSSFEHLGNTAFAQEMWDGVIGFRNPLDIKDAMEVAKMSGIKEYELALSGFGRLHFPGGGYDDLHIVGVTPNSPFRSINLTSGRLFTGANERAILYNNILSARKLKPGDTVTIETAKGKFEMEVAGLIEEFSFGQIYMPLATAEGVLGLKDKRTGFLATFTQDPHRMEKQFYKNELVEYVTIKADIVKIAREILANIRSILYVSLAISLCISLFLLFASVTVNILDRQREYATLQSLGLPDKSLIGSIYIELVVEVILALTMSIPISVALAAFFNHEMSAIWPAVETYLRVQDFLLIMLPALIILPLAAIPGIRSLLGMDIAEVLRSRAFG